MNFAQLWGILLLTIWPTVYTAKVEPSFRLETTSIDPKASLQILENLAVALEECIVAHELDVCETIFSTALEKSLEFTEALHPSVSTEVLDFLQNYTIVRWFCYLKGRKDPTNLCATLCRHFSSRDIERIFDMPPRISRLRVSVLIYLLDDSDDLYSVAKTMATPIVDNLIMDTLQNTSIRRDRHKPVAWKDTGLLFDGFQYFAREFPTDLARVLSQMATSAGVHSSFIVKYSPLLSHLFLPHFDGQGLKSASKSIKSFEVDYLFALDFYLQVAESLSKLPGNNTLWPSLRSDFMMESANRVLSNVTSHLRRDSIPKTTIYTLLERHVPNVKIHMMHRLNGSLFSDGQHKAIPWKIEEAFKRVYANSNNHFTALLPPHPETIMFSKKDKRIVASYPVFNAYQRCLTLLSGHECARILEVPMRNALELIQAPCTIRELLDLFPGVRWALMADLQGVSTLYGLRFTPQSLLMALQGYKEGIDDRWMYSLIAGVNGIIARKPYLISHFVAIAPQLLPSVLTHKEMQKCANRDWRSCGPFCSLLNLTLKVAPHLLTDEDAKIRATDELIEQIQILEKVMNKNLWTKLDDLEFTGDWLLALELVLYQRRFPIQPPTIVKIGELIRTICFAEGRLNRLTKKEVLIPMYLLKYGVPRVAEVYFQYRQGLGKKARLLTETDFSSLFPEDDRSKKSLQSIDPITWALVIHGYHLNSLGPIPLKDLPVELRIMYDLVQEFRLFPERFSHIDPTKVCLKESQSQSQLNSIQITRVIWNVPDLSGLQLVHSFEKYCIFRDALIDVFLHFAFKLPLYSTKFAQNRLREEDYLTYKEFASFATFTLDRYCFTHLQGINTYEIVAPPSESEEAPLNAHGGGKDRQFCV